LFGLFASSQIPSRNYAREETPAGWYVFACVRFPDIQSLKLGHFILQSGIETVPFAHRSLDR